MMTSDAIYTRWNRYTEFSGIYRYKAYTDTAGICFCQKPINRNRVLYRYCALLTESMPLFQQNWVPIYSQNRRSISYFYSLATKSYCSTH